MDAFDVIINNLVKLTLKRGIINKDNLSWGFSIGTYYNNKFIFHKKSRDSICFSDFFTHPQEKDTDLYYEAKKSFNKMLQESEALKNQLKENNFSLKTDISSLKSGESPFTTEPRLLKKEDYAILEKNFKAFFNQLVGNICSIYIKKFNEQ